MKTFLKIIGLIIAAPVAMVAAMLLWFAGIYLFAAISLGLLQLLIGGMT